VWTCIAIVDGTWITTVRSHVQSGSGEETVTNLKRKAAAEAFKKLEEPVHWLAFLSAQHHFEVRYEIYEEEGEKICCVHVDGYEAGRVKYSGPVAAEKDMEKEMIGKAAREAIGGVELRIATRKAVWEEWEGSPDEEWA
jgi:hypothetical protein